VSVIVQIVGELTVDARQQVTDAVIRILNPEA
jgi:hypothetical protein